MWASGVVLTERKHNPRSRLRAAGSSRWVLREYSQTQPSSTLWGRFSREGCCMASGGSTGKAHLSRALECHISPASHLLGSPHSAQDPPGAVWTPTAAHQHPWGYRCGQVLAQFLPRERSLRDVCQMSHERNSGTKSRTIPHLPNWMLQREGNEWRHGVTSHVGCQEKNTSDTPK